MSAWDTGANNDLDELLSLEDELREKARAVRECPLCHSGNIDETLYLNGRSFPAVRRCSCFLAWQDAGRDLNIAIRRYEKRTKETYSRWTSDMDDLTSRSTGPYLEENEIEVLREGLFAIMDHRKDQAQVKAEVTAEIAKREVDHHEARF